MTTTENVPPCIRCMKTSAVEFVSGLPPASPVHVRSFSEANWHQADNRSSALCHCRDCRDEFRKEFPTAE